MTILPEKLLYLISCLIPIAITSSFQIALQVSGRLKGKDLIGNSSTFPLFKLFKSMQPCRCWESTLFSLQFTKFFYYLILTLTSFQTLFSSQQEIHSFYFISTTTILFILTISLVFEFSLFLLIEKKAESILKFLAFPTTLLLIPCFPLLFLYFQLKKIVQRKEAVPPQKTSFRLQDKLLEYLSESELNYYLDKNEKKLIHTVVSFKDRIVREVMVPRVDIFSLPSDISIKEAADYFLKEGYSRIPVYKENVDKIIGVILYKDVLSIYTKYIEKKDPPESLNKSVEHILKPVLYTPETKKIALLLQEFRNKQIHLAIVVDEYGGTEGIVTIEDVLEELVGNIEDEYDTQEEKTFFPISSGGWIVDAKMSILDLEEDLNVHIPTNSEYDTIGGYIFHRAGSIPSKGWKIHLDEIDLEILRSDERSIQKIKITERNKKNKK